MLSNIIGIIADDLTGANDTALQFHLRGANTQILLDTDVNLQNIKNGQTWAISTESRNCDSQTAYNKVIEASTFLAQTLNLDHFYKKIDSTLRGNIAVETLAMLEVLELDAAIIIPAFPTEGRITVGGYHLLKGVPIGRSEVARDPLSPIFESHIPTLLKSQLPEEYRDIVDTIELKTVMNGAGPILMRIKDLIEQGKRLLVADAVSVTDIEQLVLAIKKSDFKILPTGTAACAQALGNIWLPEMKHQHITKKVPTLPKLVISGSATEMTAIQIEKLENCDDFENTYFIELDNETILNGVSEELTDRVLNNLGNNNVVVIHTSKLINEFDGFSEDAFDAELTREKFAHKITDFLAELTQAVTAKKQVILITLGGETSYKCCNAIDARQLQLIDEVSPSIALSMDYNAQWIVTKSGNLGNSNTLIDILKYFETHE